jgi:hypothetical protein
MKRQLILALVIPLASCISTETSGPEAVQSIGGSCEGFIFGYIGSPVANHPVHIYGENIDKAYDIRTDANGRFEQKCLVPDRYIITVKDKRKKLPKYGESPTLWYQRIAVEIKKGQATRVDFSMAETGSIEGKVDLSNCSFPHDDSSIHFELHNLGTTGRFSLLNHEGNFRAEKLCPGKYKLDVWTGQIYISSKPIPFSGVFLSYSRFITEIRIGETTHFSGALPEGGSLRGRVGPTKQGENVGKVQILAIGEDSSCKLWTDDLGRFEIPYLPPGEYGLVASYAREFKILNRPRVIIKKGTEIDDVVIKVEKYDQYRR